MVKDTKTKDELNSTLPKSNDAFNAISNAPVVIVACAELGKSGYIRGKLSSDKGDWYMFDVALAMQNLVLAAHSLGLGTVYISLSDAKKAASILGVPAGFYVLAMTPLGYPDQQRSPTPRKELAEIVFYEKWGHK